MVKLPPKGALVSMLLSVINFVYIVCSAGNCKKHENAEKKQ